MSGSPVVLWDFDYTLGFRGVLADDGARHPWGYCVLEVLDLEEPGHTATLDTIRAPLHDGFPWHRHAEPHTHLADADSWWRNVEPLFGRAFEAAGLAAERAIELAGRFRHRFVDVSAWSLYPDSLEVLKELSEAGWRHAIVSNHVPELEEILAGLGLDAFVDHVVCSALTGYEKPHAEAFRAALRLTGSPERVWMVGDSPIADVQGAEAIGIPAIQVRTKRADGVRRYSPDLAGVIDILRASGSRRPR
ncbi:MAG TPA: HAD-IA family hydrolase [Actinomycetota bacterium]|jgi:putative hydrolase of the HAD superfamily|nr:HAD-IA family hydrolase [Actinomycetota bacterium]